MPTITLKDILINARQESVQMKHHYLGVEHLFIAMLQIRDGLTASIIGELGLTTDYVIDSIRRKTNKGSDQRLWAGFPYTPRTDLILDIAKDMALDNGQEDITERELLAAMLAENESLPIRVVRSLGVNLNTFTLLAETFTPETEPQPPDISVIFGEEFDTDHLIQREQLLVLRRIFPQYPSVRIERRLTGFSEALILVVIPIHADGRADAPVVVKIARTDSILDEVQRYETYVKATLPLQTARLEDNPVVPDNINLAGIKYTLVANSGSIPMDLRDRIQLHGTYELGRLLQKELYGHFRKTWWDQKRPYRFQVWKEYDWLLPPLLVLDMSTDDKHPSTLVLRAPVNRMKLKIRQKNFRFGDYVVLENFTVQKIDQHNNTLKLAVGFGSETEKRAYKIELRGFEPNQTLNFRGEVIERLSGKIWKTRHDLLLDYVRDLEPDFSLDSRWIPLGELQIPNPLFAYEELLDRYINGSVSKIHGDLHLGNILVGPNNTMWLIDFGHARDGHTLFDWSTLEVSLLGDGLMPMLGEDWQTAGQVLQCILALDSTLPMPQMSDQLFSAMGSLAALREIVKECLTVPDSWGEYFIALALCALRAITWKTMSLGGRRLMFLLAALALHELGKIQPSISSREVSSSDKTEHLAEPVPRKMNNNPRPD
jgi:hypothetical protein